MDEYQILHEDFETFQHFVSKCDELLHDIKQKLRQIETTEEDTAFWVDLIRNFHTMKSLSSFEGIIEMTALSHQAELLLENLLDGKFELASDLATLLLDCCDSLGAMVDDLRQVCNSSACGDLRFALTSSAQREKVKAELAQAAATAKGPAQPQAAMECERKDSFRRPAMAGPAEEKTSEDALMAAIKSQAADGVMESFLTEADEHIDIVADQLLLRLCENDQDADALADIFRRVHTIKGLLGVVLSVELEESPLRSIVKELQGAFHSLETSFEKIRQGEIPVSERVISLCYAAVDGVRQFSDSFRRGEELDAGVVLHEWRSIAIRADDREKRGESAVDAKPTLKRPTAKAASALVSVSSASIRVSEEKLNRLMNIVGEMAIGKNAFSLIANKLMMEHNLPGMAREVRDAGQWVARVFSELEDSVMGIRMTEVKGLFQKFPRVVRDIAMQTGKKIALQMEGEDTELDKNIIEQISDPLMHLVRNAADHGMELPAARSASGKDPQGKIVLRAYNRGKHVMIEVEDDGPGMDPDLIKKKAVQKGMITGEEAGRMSKYQALQLIFLPGFSTAETVSDISGRGVGMDVVKTNVGNLKGTVLVDSDLGRGSKVAIQLPLTLAVSRGLLVEAAGLSMIIPIENITEIVKIPRERLVVQQGKMLFCHRNEVLGVASLSEVLGQGEDEVLDIAPIIIITDGKQRIGVTVRRLRSEMDVLIKPLPDYLSSIPGMAGATILGDGRVALVLNPMEIIRMAAASE